MDFVLQAQTEPSLKGYIKGLLPLPTESYFNKTLCEAHPISSVQYIEAKKKTFRFRSCADGGWDRQAMLNVALGAVWDTRISIMGLEDVATQKGTPRPTPRYL
ncbi:uncharacterized protein LY79DRAFT_708606 [Colletotrichum navitas]|uniref:Uncharacterized protein n=1 Tax=Colletotrichum navitas TaxID=681940 RepID=A0AAD8PII0_9PEZI|nr:uncharacterized protein LY79DRAFT_708606 [Colletotrichum navitas]KAK1561310.1 hypothetical protein LY79DRAFT_708606 [Colletotrichum navitas]